MIQRCLASGLATIVLLSVAGCVSDNVSRGESFKVDTYFDLYFAPGVDPEQSWASQGQDAMKPGDNDRSFPLSEEMQQQLIANPLWTAPEGIVLENTELKIGPTNVRWQDGVKRYSIGGYRIGARCSANVTRDAKPGSKGKIVLRLPGLTEVTAASRT